MNKITINSIDNFLVFLNTIAKVVPAVEFNITPEETTILAINESKTIRINAKTNSIVSDEPITFCFSDIIKLHNTFSIIKDVDESKTTEINFNGTFISYTGKTKFKLKTVKSDIMKIYICDPLKSTLKDVFSFEINPTSYKNSLKMGNILSGSEDIKIYLICEDGKMLAEFDDKMNKFSDSVTYPISDKLTGTLERPLVVSQDVYRIFGVLPTSNVQVNLTNKNVLSVRSSCKLDETYIDLNIICSILKG
jgi:hypothetical protein